MKNCVVLITNNPELHQKIPSARLVKGSSLDVLVVVRDAVHQGARLLTHPLCGNLRPHQQPFRSVLISVPIEKIEETEGITEGIPTKGFYVEGISEESARQFSAVPFGHPARVDLDSLSLIEEALLLYHDYENRLLLPENLPEATRGDYAFVDTELMRESLARYRLSPEVF